MLSAHMYAPDLPDPDLLIRTAGEMRISNFLLWGIAYSEIWVTPTLWPDFTPALFTDALEDYQRRTRKFGAVVVRETNRHPRRDGQHRDADAGRRPPPAGPPARGRPVRLPQRGSAAGTSAGVRRQRRTNWNGARRLIWCGWRRCRTRTSWSFRSRARSGLGATLAALEAGKDVALATKEVLVAAGEIVTAAARKSGARILPIDSEHSAIFQCLQGQKPEHVERLWLTASGGPFREWTGERMARATVDEALHHPTWPVMGRKITIDSATLMNKALEMIEARWLFDVPIERVGVVIHPQSVIHSLVELCDGSMLAQMGLPDMRVPIEVALLYPDRADLGLPRFDIQAQQVPADIRRARRGALPSPWAWPAVRPASAARCPP